MCNSTHFLIVSLRLAIGFWVEARGEATRHPEQSVQLVPEPGGKLRTLTQQHVLWETEAKHTNQNHRHCLPGGGFDKPTKYERVYNGEADRLNL